MPGPMDGIRIVELSVAITGPLAVAMLVDQGADAIKVEQPGLGDQGLESDWAGTGRWGLRDAGDASFLWTFNGWGGRLLDCGLPWRRRLHRLGLGRAGLRACRNELRAGHGGTGRRRNHLHSLWSDGDAAR